MFTLDAERLQQLQREEIAIRQLLDCKVSEYTRPHLEELLRLVREEIANERNRASATA
jgi:hypothetical protein